MAGINLTVNLEYEEVIERLKAEGWVVPVRCKECKWHEDEKTSVVWCPRVGAWVYNDWYCADGKRKGGDE